MGKDYKLGRAITLILILQSICSVNIRGLLGKNLSALEFLKQANWFELKNFYYLTKNKPQINRLAKSDEKILLDSIENNIPFEDGQEQDLSEQTSSTPKITVTQYFDNFSVMAEAKLREIISYRMDTILLCLKELIQTEHDWQDNNSDFFKNNVQPHLSLIHI